MQKKATQAHEEHLARQQAEAALLACEAAQAEQFKGPRAAAAREGGLLKARLKAAEEARLQAEEEEAAWIAEEEEARQRVEHEESVARMAAEREGLLQRQTQAESRLKQERQSRLKLVYGAYGPDASPEALTEMGHAWKR